MSTKTISAILKRAWLIETGFATSQLPIILRMLKGEPVSFASDKHKAYDDDHGSFEPPKTKLTVVMEDGVLVEKRYHSFKDAAPGSIALIPITGPILKYGGMCGEPGSIHIAADVQEARASRGIQGAIFKIDSPGGQVDGTATLADIIASFEKPNFGFIDDGMMASAAMWIGSATQEIYASQPTDEAGSIGVFTTIYDYRDYFAKEGIKVEQIYADQSVDKNKDYRDAIDGNFDLIKADLNFIADRFISVVTENRKGKIDTSVDNPFTGKMYKAEMAKKVGLIDGIASMQDLFSELTKKTTKVYTSNNTTSMFNKYPQITALKGKSAEEITEAMLETANAELTVSGISNVVLVSKKDAETLSDKVATLTNQVAQLSADKKKLEDKVSELEAADGAAPLNGKKEGDQITNDPANEAKEKFNQMSHHKAVDNLING